MPDNNINKDGITEESEARQSQFSAEELEIMQVGAELASIANREETDTEMENDRPFCVNHHRHYHEGGIIASVPMTFQRENYGALRRLEFRYILMNYAFEQARTRNRVDYRFLTLIAPLLSRTDKVVVYNRLRSRRDGLIPVKVTILRLNKLPVTMARSAPAMLITREFGAILIGDCNDIPCGLTIGQVYRYESTTGKRFFRLGWTVKDEEWGHNLEADGDRSANPDTP